MHHRYIYRYITVTFTVTLPLRYRYDLGEDAELPQILARVEALHRRLRGELVL